MLERSDLLALHEPLEGLEYIGPLDIGRHRIESGAALVDWLLNRGDEPVFMKETLAPRVVELVSSNRRFLREARHAFLIRRPVEIAASFLALEGDLRIHHTGVKALHELFVTVQTAASHAPIVIDSDDLVTRPGATMRAYCTAIGLPFDATALTWAAGARPEWQRSARWHRDASESTCFAEPTNRDRYSLASHPDVRRFVARHQPFYEELRSHKLQPEASEPGPPRPKGQR